MALDLSEYPRFTLAERDRRWGRVRELMRQASCDCLVAPGLRDAEDQATSRYLSQIGGIGIHGWVVFPQNGEVTAIVESERNRDFAMKGQDWIGDVRSGDPADLVVQRLRELELDGARVGLTQFQGHYRAPEGNIPYDVVRQLQEHLPKADLYGENEVLNRARMVRGDEEVAVIEQATAANEAAIRVMIDTARPGLRQQDVWFAMNDVLTRLAGSLPARLSVTFDGASNQSLGMPIPDRIRAGALCSQEICARFQGYRAQCNHTIQVGEGDPKDYATAMRATIDVFNEMLAWLRPGRTIDELCDHYVELCKGKGAEDRSGVMYHSNGLGNDYPRLGPRSRGSDGAIVLQPNMTFTLKPVLRFPSGTATQYGDPVQITPNGARRLGKRVQEPVIVR